MLETLLSYLPVLAFLLIAWIYTKKAKKFEFDVLAAFAIFAVAAKVGIQFFTGNDSFIINMGLIAVGALLFFFIILSVGDKLSGETSLTLSAALALSPWFSGLVVFAISVVVLIVALAKSLMSTMGMNTKEITTDVAFQTGLLSGGLPTLSNMSVPTEGDRVSVVPVFLTIYAAATVVLIAFAAF